MNAHVEVRERFPCVGSVADEKVSGDPSASIPARFPA